jgi:hypothetical protein
MPDQDDDKTIDSWGKRPRPKGLGTKHKHFDVPNSGYMLESIAAETETRNKFYDKKYAFTRPPNTVFGETPKDVDGQYLVHLPKDHSCYQMDPATGGTTKLSHANNATSDTLRHRIDDVVTTVMHDSRTKTSQAYDLQRRIDVDTLKAKRDLVYKELRKADVVIAKNAWEREKGLLDPDPFPQNPNLPNRGIKTTLMAFPSLRSTPEFTQRIAGLGFP